MNLPDSHLDLLQSPGTGILSTVAPSGAIQSTALWYLYDDGELKFSISSARKKLRNLQADPRATFFLLDGTNPFHFIEVRGEVGIEDDAGFAFRDRVGAHYGADVSAFDGPDDVRYVVTLRPATVNAQ